MLEWSHRGVMNGKEQHHVDADDFALATALFAMQPADVVSLSGVVVDAAGKPVSGAEVALSARIPADGSFPTLARTTTGDGGAFRLAVERKRLTGIGAFSSSGRIIQAERSVFSGLT